jgi:hypothetical protein
MRSNRWVMVTLALVLFVGAAVVVAGDEQPWFDMANCSMCKNVNPALMQKMTWKHYDLSDGIMSVTQVDAASMGDYKTMCANMEEVGKKLAAGEKLPLCRACQTYGSFIPKGMKTELVETDFGSVRLSTASDPEVVKGLHAWAATTKAEMAKMAAAGTEGAHSK